MLWVCANCWVLPSGGCSPILCYVPVEVHITDMQNLFIYMQLRISLCHSYSDKLRERHILWRASQNGKEILNRVSRWQSHWQISDWIDKDLFPHINVVQKSPDNIPFYLLLICSQHISDMCHICETKHSLWADFDTDSLWKSFGDTHTLYWYAGMRSTQEWHTSRHTDRYWLFCLASDKIQEHLRLAQRLSGGESEDM